MKNTNSKTINTKLIAKMVLFVLLMVTVFNLFACRTKGRWLVNEQFDTFKDAEKFIKESPKYGNAFILFDLDNEESVEETSYQIDASGYTKNKKVVYDWVSLYGTFHVTKDTEESKFRIDYHLRLWGIDVADNAKFEIKPLNNMSDVTELLNIYRNQLRVQTYECGSSYGLWADGKIIMEILFSGPLLEDGNYDEYYSDACDMLLENLVVIK